MSYSQPQPPQPQPGPPPSGDPPLRQSQEIQGNVLAAFNKDHQRFLLLRFGDPQAARTWLQTLEPQVATTDAVEDWNEQFSARRRESGGKDPEDKKALWLNVGLTASGLVKLSADQARMQSELQAFPSFQAGALAQAAALRDAGDSDPSKWKFGGADDPAIDAVITVAADVPGELTQKLDELEQLGQEHQVETVFEQVGETLPGRLVGREHFGFLDGVSQPGVRDFHKPDPARPEFREGKGGERLTAPGEFVVGYATTTGQVVSQPAWTKDGSFQVLRRLNQDVAGWNRQVAERAGEAQMDADKLGAKLVGRWKSGAPLELSPDSDTEQVTNDFNYDSDPPGHKTPLFGHIRKTYPRTSDQRFEDDRHRIMRRGIPFGKPFNPGGERGEGEDAERGLVFNMYCADLAAQFEFMQQQWANNPGFPPDQNPPHGSDPVIGTDGGEGTVSLRSQDGEQALNFRRFVHTRGAVYAFCPSKSVLGQLAAGQL